MSKEIVVVLPHDLPHDEALRRVREVVERARAGVAPGLVTTDVAWLSADHADIRVGALGQTIEAGIDVEERLVRVRVTLPWLLARLAGPVADRIEKMGGDALRIGHRPQTAAGPRSPE